MVDKTTTAATSKVSRSRKSAKGAPTVQDVARLAKVSVGSVSRVLNGRENVSPAIQDAVRAAMAELDFVPNVVARSMRKGSSSAIGCLISDITQHTAAQMVSAAEERLRERGFEILVANTHYDLEREQGILYSLKQRRIDGFIGAISNDEMPQYFNILHTLGMPVVLWERDAQGEFNAVLTDHADGCRQAMRCLMSLGHQRIALVAGREHTWVGREMLRGYVSACDSGGFAVNPALIFRTDLFTEQICQELLGGPSRPTALIATVNNVATILVTAGKMGLSIPQDLSVISVGDHEFASVTTPALTVVAQNPRDVGHDAADMLLQLIDGTGPRGIRRTKHPMRLIERKSCTTPYDQPRQNRTV